VSEGSSSSSSSSSSCLVKRMAMAAAVCVLIGLLALASCGDPPALPEVVEVQGRAGLNYTRLALTRRPLVLRSDHVVCVCMCTCMCMCVCAIVR
jgi:hypothetical protein